MIYGEDIDKELKPEHLAQYTLVVEKGGTLLAYEPTTNSITTFGKPSDFLKRQFENLIAYYKFFTTITSNSFCDYFNDANLQIIVYSSTKGILKINYTPLPNLPANIEIDKLIELKKSAESLELKPFIKSAFFYFADLLGRIQLEKIVEKAADILEAANRDYEIVSKQFNFEKFKDSLLKEKEKFFTNTREVLNKIFSQLLGIPISISATVYLSYKVENSIFTLVLIGLGFLVYILMYEYFQSIYLKDILEIKKDFESDFNIIKTSSGLPLDIVTKESGKIKRRIDNARNTSIFLIIIMAILALCVFCYLGNQIHEIWNYRNYYYLRN